MSASASTDANASTNANANASTNANARAGEREGGETSGRAGRRAGGSARRRNRKPRTTRADKSLTPCLHARAVRHRRQGRARVVPDAPGERGAGQALSAPRKRSRRRTADLLRAAAAAAGAAAAAARVVGRRTTRHQDETTTSMTTLNLDCCASRLVGSLRRLCPSRGVAKSPPRPPFASPSCSKRALVLHDRASRAI